MFGFRPFVSLLLAVAVPAGAFAQLALGDVVVNVTAGLRVYHPDGTFVFATTGATGSNYWGATYTANGRLVSAHSSPTTGVSFFDASGEEVFQFATPEVGAVGDVSVFDDGTIAVCDNSANEVELYTPAGAHTGRIMLPANSRAFGSVVTAADELWVSDTFHRTMRRFTRAGTPLNTISTGSCPPSDIDVADDETLWTILGNVGPVQHFTQAGALLGQFSTGWQNNAVGCAVDMEGNVWVSRSSEIGVRRYTPTGNLIGMVMVPGGEQPRFITIFEPTLAVPYCSPALPNSVGVPARIVAEGSPFVAANSLTLTALDLPPGEFGYFLVGANQGAFTPPGSQGVLCLVCGGFSGCGGIGRFNQAGRIIQGPVGTISVDLTSLPLSPPVTVTAGETWNFQCWYRDLASNNFTDALSVTFL